jgi:hypothetical protein
MSDVEIHVEMDGDQRVGRYFDRYRVFTDDHGPRR